MIPFLPNVIPEWLLPQMSCFGTSRVGGLWHWVYHIRCPIKRSFFRVFVKALGTKIHGMGPSFWPAPVFCGSLGPNLGGHPGHKRFGPLMPVMLFFIVVSRAMAERTTCHSQVQKGPLFSARCLSIICSSALAFIDEVVAHHSTHCCF
jgi:hypothetical protein